MATNFIAQAEAIHLPLRDIEQVAQERQRLITDGSWNPINLALHWLVAPAKRYLALPWQS
jgi:hypothetical protein